MPWPNKKTQDEATAAIYTALRRAFPELPTTPEQVVYRYNPVALRVRVVTDRFAGKSTAERDEMVSQALKGVPPEVTEDITIQLMLTPDETGQLSLVQREFDHPTDSNF